MEYTCHYDSPLGGITLASDGKSLTGLWFDGQKYFADNLANAFGEDVRRRQKCRNADLVELGSPSFYKRG